MKTSKMMFIAALAVVMVSLSACGRFNEGIQPSKTFITRNYTVTEFDKVNASTVGNIVYDQSGDGSTVVEVYGPDNIVELIKVSIKDNTLHLSMDKSKKVRNVKNLEIRITTPDLSAITFTGVGNVTITDGLSTPSLALDHHGVGNVEMDKLKVDEISVNTNGVGNIVLAGQATTANLSTNGVGNIEAFNLKAATVTARSGGVGNIECYASESVTAVASGIGNIEYKGKPVNKDTRKSGIGSVRELD